MQLLVQVDKLVQLIESPVFTCKHSPYLCLSPLTNCIFTRPPITAARTRAIPLSLQVPVRAANAASAKQRVSVLAEPTECCELRWLSSYRSKIVSSVLSASVVLVLALSSSTSAAGYSNRSKLGRGDEIKWQDLLIHFRSVQLRHEKLRRGEESEAFVDHRDKPSANGMAPGPGRPNMRRRVTGTGGEATAGLPLTGAGPPSPVPGAAAGSSGSGGRGGSILSPLNPRRAVAAASGSGLLGFTHNNQNANSGNRPKSPTSQPQAQSRLRRTLPGLGKHS